MIFLFIISIFVFLIKAKKVEEILTKKNSEFSNNFQANSNEDLFEIANYERIDPKHKDYFYIPIFGTSDIHGHFYPEYFEAGELEYSQGGLDYMGKYINIIREEFDNQFLYLDAGDIFQGGTESTMSEGDIILDFLNAAKANASTIGNHEFDYNKDLIENKVKNSKFPFIAANLYDTKKKTKKVFGDNHYPSYVYTFTDKYNNNKQIKIGVVGLALFMSKSWIAGKGYEDINILDYKDELMEEVNKLRKDSQVKAVILLSHVGIECGETNNLTLNMYKPKDEQDLCKENTHIVQLLKSLKKGVIDAIVTGHSHREAHHFIDGIPIISPINNGIYANIIYLPFERNNNYALNKDLMRIEGPLPICEKVFKKDSKCGFVKASEIEKYSPLVNYKFHGVKIEADPAMKFIHQKYDADYKKNNEEVCRIVGTEDVMRTELNGSYYLGNIATDIQKFVTGADISILSYGILRTSWNPGRLYKNKVQDLLPFGNKMCTFKMNGNEVKKMMKTLQTGFKKYYMTSGIKQIMYKKDNKNILSDVKLFDGYQESDLIPDQDYMIVANSYFAEEAGDDFNPVFKWYKPRSLNCSYGTDFEITYNFLKDQKVIDVKHYMDVDNPRIRFIEE